MSRNLPKRREWSAAEVTVLDAVRTCCERWGMDKTTIDDIARESDMSRATLYRMFPGGREILFEAHRVHELDQFFSTLLDGIGEIDNLHDLLARAVSLAMRELSSDDHLAAMLSSEPGQVISELTVEGLPRIIRVATAYLSTLVEPFLPRAEARQLIDLTGRLVISYFLAPSDTVDLSDERQAHAFIAPFLPAVHQRLDDRA